MIIYPKRGDKNYIVIVYLFHEIEEMKEGHQIKPEWVPSAYKEEKPEAGSEEEKKENHSALLYSGKKTPLRSHVNKGYRRPYQKNVQTGFYKAKITGSNPDTPN